MIKDLKWHSLQERRAMSLLALMYKDGAWPSRCGSIKSSQQRTCNQTMDKSAASGTLWQTRTVIDLLFPADCARVELPQCPTIFAVSTQLRLSGPNWHKRSTLQPWSLVDTTSYTTYYDWDDCWPAVPYIPYESFARNRFRFRIPCHIWILKVATTSRRPRLGQKPRVKPAVVCCTNHYFTEKTHTFSFCVTIKTKNHMSFSKNIKILYFRSKI